MQRPSTKSHKFNSLQELNERHTLRPHTRLKRLGENNRYPEWMAEEVKKGKQMYDEETA